MGRLETAFAALKAAGRKAYIGYAMAGFPERGLDLDFARAVLAESDVLELGVPFSDPIADGPVLQRCAERALAAGGGLDRAMELAAALRKESDKPLVLMSYLNPLLAGGLDTFAHRARVTGVDAVVVPDLPPEEDGLLAALRRAGLDVALLAAPTSTPERLDRIARAASGFVYVVSVAGVTGEREGFDGRLEATVRRLRARARVPLAIGFGVSGPEAARRAAGLADGVVVASTVLKAALGESDPARAVAAARERCALLAAAVRGA